ncbi:MAG: hypothetical protein UU43_C0001G0126 [Candidatus Falkowbacteria bacterium GW2011_GWA2_41_14]|uniref:Uncharacterized protein n=1 Tax=Candidatus Falkowbacteria bacterium GW2011_GWA2_41_14 TaxID=1618635 RepID=A0A0G0UWP2_9BACT|nr:MAG: hypothetical protein UU43_C0001G0126 [Candidatus Falkowbacteria bacterium GW2011_GWA2_41_14]
MKKKMFKKIMALAAFLLAVNCVFSALPALAAVDDANIYWGGSQGKQLVVDNSGLPSNPSVNDPRRFIAEIIRIVLGFLGIIAVIIVLYAGFKWMLSGGSEEKIGEAKKMLIAGVIGLIIILSAFIIASFVISAIIGAAN